MSEQELKFGMRSAELHTIPPRNRLGAHYSQWGFLTGFNMYWIKPKRALFSKILRWILLRHELNETSAGI